MLDLFPPISACLTVATGTGELCIEFPGGFRVCANYGYEIGDPSTIVQSLLGNANAALAPLKPLLDIADFAKKIFDCVAAIPDALGPPPDPTKLLACLPALKEALDKLLAILPPMPIFTMVKGMIQAIIVGLLGLRQKIAALIAKLLRISAAGLRAEALGNIRLAAVVECATSDVDAQLENLNASMAPLNRLLGIVNVLLKLAGGDCIPTLGSITAASNAALVPLDAAIALLQVLEAAIPGSIMLPDIPAPTDPC